MSEIFFLDSRTKDSNHRVTSFADTVADVVADFAGWLKEFGISPEELEYADIFVKRGDIPDHIGKVIVEADGSCFIEGTPGSTLNPYTRKRKRHFTGGH